MTIHIHKEIDRLKKMILEMGTKVEHNLHEAVKTIVKFDLAIAERLMGEEEDIINQMEIDIEEECLKTLALHQPVAVDLRVLVVILKINNELERINDFSVNLAERAIDLNRLGAIQFPFDFLGMAELSQAMLAKCLDSLIHMNPELAREVIASDDEVDSRHAAVYQVVKEEILSKPEKIDITIQYPSISRYLERVADLACNIAEDVIYLVEGDIVRHQEES